MDFDALRSFVAVADAGSFLAVADARYLSRTTLRRQIEALEAQVGTTLFVRTRQGVTLTEAGEQLARGARALLQQSTALLGSVQELAGSPRGRLRILLPVGLPPQVLVPMVAAYRARWPGLRVETRLSANPAAERLDEADVALCFDNQPAPAPWITRRLADVDERLVASPQYLQRHGTPTRPEQLAQHVLLAWDAPGGDARSWGLAGGGTLRVDPVLVSADVHLLRSCAGAAIGIAFVPDGLLAEDTVAPVVPVLEGVVGRRRQLQLLVPEALAEVPKIRRFVELVETMVRALPVLRG